MKDLGTTGRLVGFAGVLGAVFAAALAVGAWAGPVETPGGHGHGGFETLAPLAPQPPPGGLMTSQDGYTFTLDRPATTPGQDVAVAFTIVGPDGHPVPAYDVTHDKKLHLVAVRRDQTGFQHVHPRRDSDGTWRTALDLTPGSWRLFADFAPLGGDPLTLGTDLAVSGAFEPAPEEPVDRVAEVDGYTVELSGDLTAGEESDLTLTVTRDGRPVTDLQPYLGAYGHLVALRDGDLAYLHVHPHESTAAGPEVRFTAMVPSEGRYHLYLDFRHGGVVRTAAFPVEAGGQAGHGH